MYQLTKRHFLIVYLGLVTILTPLPAKTEKQSNNAYRVVVGPVTEEIAPLQLPYIGNMQANNSAAIKARVTGDVIDYHFKEGSYVEAGQLLFTIDPRPYEATLAKALAQLAETEAQLAYAEVQVIRYERLVEEEFVSIDDYEQYITDVATLEAQVQERRAEVALAELNLNYCYVKAPFSGRTGQRLTDPGNLVESQGGSADPTLVMLNQINPIKAVFAVPETDLQLIRQAQEAESLILEISRSETPDQVYTGELWLIDNQINMQSGMIILEGLLPNPDGKLWPGQFVNVVASIKSSTPVLLVPSEAVMLGQNGPYVYTVNSESKAIIRQIKTERGYGDKTIVRSGLKAGERVVVEGQEGLQSGLVVRVGNKSM